MSEDKKDPTVVTGQVAKFIPREAFKARFEEHFYDPAFDGMRGEIARLETIAWDGYHEGRKSPRTAKAGPEFKDPDYDLSIEWRANRDRLVELQKAWPTSPLRVLIVCGSPRNDGSCPGEMSKTFRLAKVVETELQATGMATDLLDLSEQTNEYGKAIHPCKGCVSTAMPLCHWPCSCYPNHALGEIHDAMADIYERFVAAHGVIFITPTHWYQSPSVLKLMIDRLVCADGGNPDPTSTHGKKAVEAKKIELDGWDYPQHLAGRAYGVLVHGDVAGIEPHRRGLSDWLDWMGLVDAGKKAKLDRYLGYFEPYATSHAELDADTAFVEETRNVARAVAAEMKRLRAGERPGDEGLTDPRPK
jgi:multimeric flavodoxin WrbA